MTDPVDPPRWLPEADDEVRPEAQQRRIIESNSYPMRVLAGAGTGKTFTMVRKIEHLVDEQGVSPDRVLALTFTNNAADSMREKLNAKLGTAGYDVDAYTYHSICNALLTEYAYDADLPPDFEVAMDAEKYAIVLDVLDEMTYRTVKPNVYGSDSYADGAAAKLLSFIGSMKRSGITPADIETFLGSTEHVYAVADMPDRIGDIASDHLGGRSVGTVLDGLPAVREALIEERTDLGDGGLDGAVSDFLNRLIRLCEALEAAFESHEAGTRDLPENAHKLPKYLLGGYSSAPTGIPDGLDLELTDQLSDFLDDCLVACDLNTGYAAYERELDERALLDFDGLVVRTVDLLNSPVGDEIAARWDYVFCDEFQDTDRLQFELVSSLVTDDNLFVVGDDDQAIYEWRGAHTANITSELDATYGASLTDEPLEDNFRSRQPILDLANDALDNLDHRERQKTLTRVDEPDYDGDSVAVIEEAEDETSRSEQITTTVQNLLSGSADEIDTAYAPGDIGLLVRKNKHATPILEAFDEAGIPYTVAGDLATESVGVGTITAYLKALAQPEGDEVSWNRVLTMRYRLCNADLRRLNEGDEPLVTSLLEAPFENFDEPARIREARTHITELLDLRDRASLARLYQTLKERTNIEWYLSEQERRDLTQLDDIVAQYGPDAVQPSLSPEFIDSLAHYESLFDESGSTPTSQPDVADGAVNVMTIHKSKGLDFPVVILPRLTPDEWEPSTRSYDALEAGLSDGPTAAFADDFLTRDRRETRRVLHVGLTRAEDVLVLQGTTSEEADENTDDRAISEAVETLLPPEIPWRPDRGSLPIWSDLCEALPADAANWTETVVRSASGDHGGRVDYGTERLTPDCAREHVFDLGDQVAAGTLDTHLDNTVFGLESLSGPATPQPAIQHSYTSLATFDTCPRKHYLDHVVNAFHDYLPTDGSDFTGVSQQVIGTLFHDTAELAAEEGSCDRDRWMELCEHLANQRRKEDALESAIACIDRFFETDLPEWELRDAEREFELTVAGHTLTGFIDAVYRRPSGENVVIDYKATQQTRDITEDTQLPLYLLACRDLYGDSIAQAGYAFVGPIGPHVQIQEFSDDELETVRSTVVEGMERIEDGGYGEYQTGQHCEWCAHQNLPCGHEWRSSNRNSDI